MSKKGLTKNWKMWYNMPKGNKYQKGGDLHDKLNMNRVSSISYTF